MSGGEARPGPGPAPPEVDAAVVLPAARGGLVRPGGAEEEERAAAVPVAPADPQPTLTSTSTHPPPPTRPPAPAPKSARRPGPTPTAAPPQPPLPPPPASALPDLVIVLAPEPDPDLDPDHERIRRDRRIARRIVLVVQLLGCGFLSLAINNLGIAMCDSDSDCRDQAAVLQPWVLGLAVLCVLAFVFAASKRDRVSQTRVQGVVAAVVLLTAAVAIGVTFSGVTWKPAGPDEIPPRSPSDYQDVRECRVDGNCPPTAGL